MEPKIDFFLEWKKTKDNDFYIAHFNEEVLTPLNPHELVKELYQMTKGKDFALIPTL